MKPLHSTFSAGAKAKLILVKNQPMLSITDAYGKVKKIYPTNANLLNFGLKKEHTDMLAWLEEESVLHALDRLEQEFVNSRTPFSIICEPLLFEKFKPQRRIDDNKTTRAPTVR
jgi:hypothetical protein